jgi:hypothetical protein
MIPDGAEPYRQRLTLNRAELEGMLNAVNPSTLQMQEGATIREVELVYNNQPKDNDLKLVAKTSGIYVQMVDSNGAAHTAGVRQGHMVTSLCHLEDGCLVEVDVDDLPDEMLHQPMRMPNAVEPIGTWPLMITFNALPAGWRILKCGAEGSETQITSYEELSTTVQAAIGSDPEVKLEMLFEKDAEEEVSRYGFDVRHEHHWEKDMKVTTTDNRSLLSEWVGRGAKMTAHQVGFAFQSLINEITEKLRSFDDEKENFQRMLEEKSRRCVETRKRHERERKADRFPNPTELENNEKEVHAVCEEVPLYFIKEMMASAKEKAAKKEADPQTSGKKVDEAKAIHTWEVYEEMHQHIERYIEELNNKSKKTENKPKKSKKKDSSEHKTNSTDGRLSVMEFEKALYNAGITWLDRQNIREKFESMDMDKSGKLNLGEILSAATRMSELVHQAQIWQREQEAKDKRIPHDELLSQYSEYLRTHEEFRARAVTEST